MKIDIIDAVVNQIKEDLKYSETAPLEELLRSLYNKKTHETFKQYLPESQHQEFEKYYADPE